MTPAQAGNFVVRLIGAIFLFFLLNSQGHGQTAGRAVHETGTNTIDGSKKFFTAAPYAPTPTVSTQLANKAYVDAAVAAVSGLTNGVNIVGIGGGVFTNWQYTLALTNAAGPNTTNGVAIVLYAVTNAAGGSANAFTNAVNAFGFGDGHLTNYIYSFDVTNAPSGTGHTSTNAATITRYIGTNDSTGGGSGSSVVTGWVNSVSWLDWASLPAYGPTTNNIIGTFPYPVISASNATHGVLAVSYMTNLIHSTYLASEFQTWPGATNFNVQSLEFVVNTSSISTLTNNNHFKIMSPSSVVYWVSNAVSSSAGVDTSHYASNLVYEPGPWKIWVEAYAGWSNSNVVRGVRAQYR